MLGDIPLDKNLKFKFLLRHQVLAYDDTVKVDPTPFVEFIKAIPSKQSLRLYDCVIVDQSDGGEEKMRLFSDVFTIRDPHPTKPGQYIDNHFASSLGPLSILFFENPAKFDQWNECNNDTFYKKRDSFEPRNDFDANAFLDVGVALGCITGYALSLGLDPSFLGCVRPNPEFPYNDNNYICSIHIGKGIAFTNNHSKTKLHKDRAKLFRPPGWDILGSDHISPSFLGQYITWIDGDDYVQNKVEMYGA